MKKWSKETLPNRNWAFFVRYLKIINTFVKNHMIILKQIVWET